MGILSKKSLRDSIELLDSQATGTNEYGDAVYSNVSLGVWPASVTVASQTEDENNRQTFTAFYTFIVEATCPVEGVDSVLWRGKTYEVVGDPKEHSLFDGTPHHKEFQGRVHRG